MIELKTNTVEPLNMTQPISTHNDNTKKICKEMSKHQIQQRNVTNKANYGFMYFLFVRIILGLMSCTIVHVCVGVPSLLVLLLSLPQ